MKITSILICLLCVLLMLPTLTYGAEDPVAALDDVSPWTAMVIGNEYEIGGGVAYQWGETRIGVQYRWGESRGGREETQTIAIFGEWLAVPEVSIPLGGLFPQFNLPLPESINVALKLGGILGYEQEYKDAVLRVYPAIILNPSNKAQIEIRYEYAFDSDLWSQLADDPRQDQTLLSINAPIRF